MTVLSKGSVKSTGDYAKPLISIITVVFNGAGYIEKTIRSIIGQSFENFEYIIIDGGSTDGTVDIIRDYESSISYWISENDLGIYDAMNKAQQFAVGDFLWFINAGDEISDMNILMDLSLVAHRNIDYFYSETKIINRDGLIKKTTVTPVPLSFSLMTKGMHVSHQSFIPRREIALKYDVQYNLIADQKWILDCMVCGKGRGYFFLRPMSRYMAGGISDIRSLDCVFQKMLMIKNEYPSYFLRNLPGFIFEASKAFLKTILRAYSSWLIL